EPTLRSIPPATITGVKASANRPISVLRRTISRALAREAKLVPMMEKIATSATSRSASNNSCGACRAASAGSELGSRIVFLFKFQRVRRYRAQNDGALNCPGPIGFRAQENECRTNCPQKQPTDELPK